MLGYTLGSSWAVRPCGRRLDQPVDAGPRARQHAAHSVRPAWRICRPSLFGIKRRPLFVIHDEIRTGENVSMSSAPHYVADDRRSAPEPLN